MGDYNYLRKLRKTHGYTLVELERLTGYSNPYLSQIENGQKGLPTRKVLQALADVYDITVADMYQNVGYFNSADVSAHVEPRDYPLVLNGPLDEALLYEFIRQYQQLQQTKHWNKEVRIFIED